MTRKADERRARGIAGRVLQQHGVTSPPVDPLAIAQAENIIVEPSDQLGDSFSGCLLRAGSTFGILYSTAIPNRGFQRFTIGHELGHYFLDHYHELLKDGAPHLSASGYVTPLWHEREADHFSSELLIPAFLFEQHRQGLPIGLRAVQALAEVFDASLTFSALEN